MALSILELEAEKRTRSPGTNNKGEAVGVRSVYNSSSVAEKAHQLIKQRFNSSISPIDRISDGDWVKATLFGDGYQLDPEIEMQRFWSTADKKFEDTSLGGNYICNPLPGFTPYADVPKPGVAKRNVLSPVSNLGNVGMGMYYSMAYDDSYRVLDIRVGKPEFNTIAGYLATYFDGASAVMANGGRFTSTGYTIGSVVGVGLLASMFGLGVAIPLLMAKWIAGGILGIVASNPHKFYYVRPTMPLYWLGVTNMVNQIMTHKGVFPIFETQKIGEEMVYNEQMHQDMRAIMPDVFGKSGHIDVYAVINRTERVNQRVRKAMAKAMDENETNEALVAAWGNVLREASTKSDSSGLLGLLNKWRDSELGGEGKDGKAPSVETLAGGTVDQRYTADVLSPDKPAPSFMDSPASYIADKLRMTKEYFDVEASDGAAFATFRVQENGSVSESFAHSTRPSDLGQKLNSMSAQGRAIHNTIAGGNILPGMGEFVEGAKGVLAGTLDTFGLGGLMQAAGSAYADIPEFWDNSSYNGASMDYTIHLAAPYAHPVSQLQFIWIPLCMLFNLAVPHAAGRASYTSPFLVEAYDRGRAVTRAGIISQMSITRGTSNLGFTKNKDMLACDVNFSIKSLSTALYMPIDTGFNLDPFKTIHTHDSTYSDYIATLGAATLGEQIYKGQKLRIRAKNWMKGDIQNITSMDQWAGMIRNLPGIDLLSLLYPDTGRGL